MLILDRNDPTPFYRQLYNQIRAQVLSGKLPAHAKLPSVRDLAAELSTSRNTVDGAYQELYAEGYIYSRQRSGYFVSALDQDVALPANHKKTPGRAAGKNLRHGTPTISILPAWTRQASLPHNGAPAFSIACEKAPASSPSTARRRAIGICART